MALRAHGITRTIEQKNAMVVTALYDDGEPISYAAVKIYSPDGGTVEYQNGRTDKSGRFAFVPSEAGEWLVRLDDGTGHGFEEHVRVDADLRGKASSPVLVKFGQKVIVFLLLAWGGIMTALYVRKAKAK
jgi:nickel transport protein